jgi:hypothetical protein
VHAALWPGSEDLPDADLWPDVRIRPPSERQVEAAASAVRSSEVEARGDAHITYWAWAEGAPFVKIGQTHLQVKVSVRPLVCGRTAPHRHSSPR